MLVTISSIASSSSCGKGESESTEFLDFGHGLHKIEERGGQGSLIKRKIDLQRSEYGRSLR
jgi:hypothetical protein